MSDPVKRARVFLVGFAALFIPLIAVPLFADPYWWGDLFGWDTDVRTDLTTYLGRCLGAVALAISIAGLLAARDPVANRGFFDLVVLGGVLLSIVHLRGLIDDSQPLIEHIEVGIYAGFAALGWWCKPPLPSVDEPRISSR